MSEDLKQALAEVAFLRASLRRTREEREAIRKTCMEETEALRKQARHFMRREQGLRALLRKAVYKEEADALLTDFDAKSCVLFGHDRMSPKEEFDMVKQNWAHRPSRDVKDLVKLLKALPYADTQEGRDIIETMEGVLVGIPL